MGTMWEPGDYENSGSNHYNPTPGTYGQAEQRERLTVENERLRYTVRDLEGAVRAWKYYAVIVSCILAGWALTTVREAILDWLLNRR